MAGYLTRKWSQDLAGYDLSQMIPKVKFLRKAVLGYFKILWESMRNTDVGELRGNPTVGQLWIHI